MRDRVSEIGYGHAAGEGEDKVEKGVSAGLIVRHTSRRLGSLSAGEARERLMAGSISFAEFMDQVGDDFRELLEFMTENDLHPGRPEEVLLCIENVPSSLEQRSLRLQLRHLCAP